MEYLLAQHARVVPFVNLSIPIFKTCPVSSNTLFPTDFTPMYYLTFPIFTPLPFIGRSGIIASCISLIFIH